MQPNITLLYILDLPRTDNKFHSLSPHFPQISWKKHNHKQTYLLVRLFLFAVLMFRLRRTIINHRAAIPRRLRLCSFLLVISVICRQFQTLSSYPNAFWSSKGILIRNLFDYVTKQRLFDVTMFGSVRHIFSIALEPRTRCQVQIVQNKRANTMGFKLIGQLANSFVKRHKGNLHTC